ncbi:Uu.00g145230.m01.CDS01 [Anthostomella pinea]|uniref:Uu.00g145230.m01.CDS01 n=1 Tax=Anthostomella pinea TaxID=933095 RepID=A0AAI8YLT6_9PEZI|nr:Uu.00g145230.m01.CDS01 [Anthostomella pinea]
MPLPIHIPAPDSPSKQLQSYHSAYPDARCLGHPEWEIEGTGVATGPLAQDVAHAADLVMTTKNRRDVRPPLFERRLQHDFCMVGDACLKEGIGLDGISTTAKFIGDGSIGLANIVHVSAEMCACGWAVVVVANGSYGFGGIIETLRHARMGQTEKSTFVNICTIVGLGSAVAGNAVAHGATSDAEESLILRGPVDLTPRRASSLGTHPELAMKFRDHVLGMLPAGLESSYSRELPGQDDGFAGVVRYGIQPDRAEDQDRLGLHGRPVAVGQYGVVG